MQLDSEAFCVLGRISLFLGFAAIVFCSRLKSRHSSSTYDTENPEQVMMVNTLGDDAEPKIVVINGWRREPAVPPPHQHGGQV